MAPALLTSLPGIDYEGRGVAVARRVKRVRLVMVMRHILRDVGAVCWSGCRLDE